MSSPNVTRYAIVAVALSSSSLADEPAWPRSSPSTARATPSTPARATARAARAPDGAPQSRRSGVQRAFWPRHDRGAGGHIHRCRGRAPAPMRVTSTSPKPSLSRARARVHHPHGGRARAVLRKRSAGWTGSLEIHPGAGDVSVAGVTIRDGSTFGLGGAILAASTGQLRLDAVTVTASDAVLGGSGLAASGPGAVECAAARSPRAPRSPRPAERSTLENSTLSGAGLPGEGREVRVESSSVAGAAITHRLGAGTLDAAQHDRAGGCSGTIASMAATSTAGARVASDVSGDRSGDDPDLEALAANGGPTPSHALRRAVAPALDAGLALPADRPAWARAVPGRGRATPAPTKRCRSRPI